MLTEQAAWNLLCCLLSFTVHVYGTIIYVMSLYTYSEKDPWFYMAINKNCLVCFYRQNLGAVGNPFPNVDVRIIKPSDSSHLPSVHYDILAEGNHDGTNVTEGMWITVARAETFLNCYWAHYS